MLDVPHDLVEHVSWLLYERRRARNTRWRKLDCFKQALLTLVHLRKNETFSQLGARVGQTPVVRVRGRGSGRVSMSGMTCFRRGDRSRLIYSFRVHRGRKGEPKDFTRQDYRDLIVRAHNQLKGPIVLVWDNLRTHLMPQMKEFIAANEDWLTVFHFPSYAPDLNPQEGIRSLVKRTIGNFAAANLDQLAAAVKRSLKKTQYRPHLMDGCLMGTGLTIGN